MMLGVIFMGVTNIIKRRKDMVHDDASTIRIHDPIHSESLSLFLFNESYEASDRLHLWFNLVAFLPQFHGLLPCFSCMFIWIFFYS